MTGEAEEAGAIGALAFGAWLILRELQKNAIVEAINDNGGNQTVDLTAHAGEKRTKVPVHQPFGFSSHAPLDGAVTHILSVGGDPSHLIALPPENPTKGRFGGLKEGESVLYDSAGQRIHLKDGKIIRIDIAGEFQVGFGPEKTVLQVDQDGVTITGKLSVSQGLSVDGATTLKDTLHVKRDITTTGDVKSRDVSLQAHQHETTAAPSNGPTTVPTAAGGATPGGGGDDSGDGEDPDEDKDPLPPKSEMPWFDEEGEIVGTKENGSKNSYNMPPSDDPEREASKFADKLAEYVKKRTGEKVEKVDLEVKGKKTLSSWKGKDGTRLNIRSNDQAGKLTQGRKGIITVDFNNNPDVKRTAPTKNLKFKFPNNEK